MNDANRRRFDAIGRVRQFRNANIGDFTGIAESIFNDIDGLFGDIQMSAAEGIGAEASGEFEQKATARENLRDHLSTISRTARSMEYTIDGIADTFRFNRGLPDADLLARARQFHLDSAAHNADFIAFGMPAAFRANLNTAANAFETAINDAAGAVGERVGGNALTSERIRNGMQMIRQLDGIVKNRYASDVAKLAAWATASHVESPPEPGPPPIDP